MQVILRNQFVIDQSAIDLGFKNQVMQPKGRTTYKSSLKKFRPDRNFPRKPIAMLDAFRPFLPSTAEVVRIVPLKEGETGREQTETVHFGPRFHEDQTAQEYFDELDSIKAGRIANSPQDDYARIKAERKMDAERKVEVEAAARRLGIDRSISEAAIVMEKIDPTTPKRGPGRPRKSA